MQDDADRIVDLYDRHALNWDRARGRKLIEQTWLDRFLSLSRKGDVVIDIGCGSGEPIARYVIESGRKVVGADSSPGMINLCKVRFPGETWVVADMRSLALDWRANGILAWDSFFHLRQDDQRKMFSIFRKHAAPKAALMFTSGPGEGEAIGSYEGEPLYHASLSQEEYRALLDHEDFEVVSFAAEDQNCGGHTIWLAQLR
jgi:SAM-dependent methyltransferase